MHPMSQKHVKARQELIASELHTSRTGGRHRPAAALRRFVARTLVLAGARLMPETSGFVGDRVLVLERTDREPLDHELQPAA